MTQFLTISVGNNKATIDLSKILKAGLIKNNGLIGEKAKILLYYNDNENKPALFFEFNSYNEAEAAYSNINHKLNEWAEESNAAKLKLAEEELKIMKEQKKILMEQIEIFNRNFEKFKELLNVLDDENVDENKLKELENV